jgi:hypothetical protein
MQVSLRYNKVYLVFELGRVYDHSSFSLNINVYLCFWLSPYIIFAILIWIVRSIRPKFVLLKFFNLLIYIKLIPRLIIFLNSIYIPNQLFFRLWLVLLHFGLIIAVFFLLMFILPKLRRALGR